VVTKDSFFLDENSSGSWIKAHGMATILGMEELGYVSLEGQIGLFILIFNTVI